MKKRIKKQKQHYTNLQELLFEAYEEINNRGDEIDRLYEDLEYYRSFVEYHKLELLFNYFRKNAHKEDYLDLPFDHYTL